MKDLWQKRDVGHSYHPYPGQSDLTGLTVKEPSSAPVKTDTNENQRKKETITTITKKYWLGENVLYFLLLFICNIYIFVL